ncbi:GntR family transcriptional regulator [Geomicrobium sp. JCM 19039]|uniref:GntR family transcriptional regulator n=1 Tax=Geomicrobium sp. JCM 19039 TaxID=1460636 RepID=UPI00045F4238|nr:GntR family transcriptional regulator [Geomicrobium sp. JCM 19039]GAK10671.1 transcriptional regulator, GntR family [Geomicrobium sp. JCM 19039]
MKRIENLSIRETVFQQIRQAILMQDIQPGEKLTEAEIAEQLGVSRTPVREALHKLEQENLVEIHPRRHCKVIGITPSAIREINMIRAQLEPTAARHATTRLSDHELNYIGGLLEKSRRHSDEADIKGLVEIHDQFHQTIVQGSNLPRITTILENMHEYIVSFRTSYMSRPELVQRSIEEHEAIYLALKNRDEDLVEELFKKHLEGIFEYEDVVIESNLTN